MGTEKLTEAMVRALVERYVLPTEAARLLPLLAASWLAQREALRKIANEEPAYHAASSLDASHMGGADCEQCEDFIAIARSALGEEAAHDHC